MAGNLTAMIAAIFSGSAVSTDPYFNLTTLLLSTTATNGQQNNTFLDSSTNNFTITRNGNTTQGTFSPFSQTGWGNYFDGTGDYLTAPDNAALNLSGDFTVEAWVYLANVTGEKCVFHNHTSNNNGIALNVNGAAPRILSGAGTWNIVLDSSITISANTWNHIAATRSGNTYTIWVNGVSGGTASSATNPTYSGGVQIGRFIAATPLAFNGYASNLRVVKGVAVYTGAFTPPTSPLAATQSAGTNISAITGTQTSLLTCQSNRFLDNSTNNFTITVNGDTRVVAFSPFNPTSAWSASTVGGSGYFDGSGDYLTAGVASNWTFLHNGSDWTCEFWVYHTGTNLYGIVSTTAFTAETGMSVLVNNTSSGGLVNGLQVYVTRGASGFQAVFNSTALLAINQWNYVAITFTSSTKTCSFTINGASAGSSSDTGFLYSASNPTNTLAVGRYQGPTPGGYLLGYISSLRISTNVRTGLTSVPTAPYTSDANTQLLLNFTNSGIYDATAKNVLETVGNAQASTTQSKWSPTSMYFDGTGDYLTTNPGAAIANPGTIWTVEGWFYPTTVLNTAGMVNINTGAANAGVNIYRNGTTITVDNGVTAGTGPSGGTLVANTWQHVAVASDGTSTRLFLDGTQVGSTYTGTVTSGTPSQIWVGTAFTGLNAWTGYMQDVRVTKGYARYVTGTGANAGKMVFNGTNNLALPTAAFPVK